MPALPVPRPPVSGLFGFAGKAVRQIIEEDVDDGRGVERECLAQQQSTHHGDAQRPAQLGTEAGPERQRQAPQQRGHGGHHNGTEAEQAGFVNCIRRIFPVLRSASSAKSTIMMPFFFTMPISRTMPMIATTLKSW